MLKSYFFIPSNKKEFLAKESKIEADFIVFDLEDSVYNYDIDLAVENIIEILPSPDRIIRLAYEPSWSKKKLLYVKPLVEYGFTNFLLPKIESVDDLDKISNILMQWTSSNTFNFLVLIENPIALVNLESIIQHKFVKSIGFGSHDYCESIGMIHNLSNINWARMHILNLCKAYKVEPIDIASMNILNKNEFIDECNDGFGKGYESKFIIHPWQLKLLKSIIFYSQEEIRIALAVRDYIQSIGGENNFNIITIEGIVIEKPHLKRLKKILNSVDNGGF